MNRVLSLFLFLHLLALSAQAGVACRVVSIAAYVFQAEVPGTPFPPTIHSERLMLRPFVPSDRERFLDIVTNPEVAKKSGLVGNREGWEATFRHSLSSELRERRELIAYAIVNRETGEMVGFVNLFQNRSKPTEPGVMDFGFALAPEAQGKGYGTEAGKAFVEYGFQTLGFKKIRANTAPTNTDSQKALEKIGFQRRGTSAVRLDRLVPDAPYYELVR